MVRGTYRGDSAAPETTELLQSLQRDLKPNAKSLVNFTTVPSILGTSAEETHHRISKLRKLGFSRKEVEAILLAFPVILDVDYKNVLAVCHILKECVPGGSVLRGLLVRQPFVFLLPPQQIEARLMQLKELCCDPNALGSLLLNFPTLLFASLTTSTLNTVTKAQAAGLGHGWVAKSLYHNLSRRPALSELGPDAPALVRLLQEFGLESDEILVKFPAFFKARYDHMVSVMDVLAGNPLYLETESLRTVLISVADQLACVTDTESLQNHLGLLRSFFTSGKECTAKVLSYPGLVLPQCDLAGWLEELEQLGFTQQQSAALLSQTPSALLQQREKEFIPRLRFLLKVPHTSPSDIVGCSANLSIFNTPLEVLAARLNYAFQHKPDMVSGQQLANLFATVDTEFAKLCGRTLEELHSETGLAGAMLRKFKSKRQSPKKVALEKATKLLSAQQMATSQTESQRATTTSQSLTQPRKKQVGRGKDKKQAGAPHSALPPKGTGPPKDPGTSGTKSERIPDNNRPEETKEEASVVVAEGRVSDRPEKSMSGRSKAAYATGPRDKHNAAKTFTTNGALSRRKKTIAKKCKQV